MSVWDATNHEARDNLLRVVDEQAQNLFAMAAAPGAWESPTLSTQWQVRDVVGHLIDVTESYFVGFDAAKGGESVADALGTKTMQDSLDEGARGLRNIEVGEALARLQTD
jgi:hypothetical protein